MGRLTLNILLSFAQFEREVIGERIRDKFAASRKKGMWMGGWAPLGYDVKDRKLVVNEAEAAASAASSSASPECGSATTIVRELAAEGFVNKYGQTLDKGRIYKLLNNRVYRRRRRPQGHGLSRRARGDHRQAALGQGPGGPGRERPRARAGRTRAQTPALLKGLIFGRRRPGHVADPHPQGREALPLLCQPVGHQRRGPDAMAGADLVSRVPAGEIEAAVIDQLRALLRSPEIIVATWRAARRDIPDLTEAEVREALDRFDPLWDELFPAEQARIVQLLVERVDVAADGIDVRLRVEGLGSLFAELRTAQAAEAA